MQTQPGNDSLAGSTVIFSISGRVEEARAFSLEELLGMDTVEVNDLLMACGSGEPKGRINDCRGILLTDLINLAKVIIIGHYDTRKMYVAASSNDGYATVFSWQELFNSSVGEGVMVILEKDGKRLYEEGGWVDLFSAGDFLSGPRYVKKLSNIKILMVE